MQCTFCIKRRLTDIYRPHFQTKHKGKQTLEKNSKMAEYLEWVLLTLALVVNFTMIGICAIFYFCWSKVFWREKRGYPTPEKTDIEKIP